MLHTFVCILSIGIHTFLCWHTLANSFSSSHFFHKNVFMLKLIFFPHYTCYILDILINKILDSLPLKVIHYKKYSYWKPQFIGKIERNKILVLTKVYLAQFFLSGNLQKFIHAELKDFANVWPHKTFYSIKVQISKLVKLNSNLFENFPCASRMSKLLQVYLITYAHFVIVEHS